MAGIDKIRKAYPNTVIVSVSIDSNPTLTV